MVVPVWAWALTIAVIIAMLAVDFVGHVRTPHAPKLKEAALWSAIYVAIALAFGLIVWVAWGSTFAGEYYAGFITEKSLSVDNLFVFVLIMSSFRVPREYQQKVLLFGIVIALILRTVFIVVGATVIAHFSAIFYLFGAFLLYTAWTQIRGSGHDPEEGFKENGFLRLMRRILPTSDGYIGDRMFARQHGKFVATPMFIVILAIGSADLLFAVDSIPAIFGLTQETFLVFTANAFALLGLRQLFFLLDGLLDKLVYLSYGLGAILAFIGAKLVIHAMHTNEVPFINGGEHITAIPEVSTAVSLGVIVGVLVLTTVLSLTIGRRPAEGRMAAKSAGIAHQEMAAKRSLGDYEADATAHRSQSGDDQK
ncbi:TerC/Alx family metal homeostasis membrane protein [Rarobacter faecitabidus]|uniref:Tellurite resistance protein TerC n=1 Tax=Rarobacter faecitabidus TaxID=13243 RepID=A0A542ZVX2_RARFA|nr:TerC family protein [Rarobacter faecitabidus]TQL64515.1 tellurite resistance protein TerC [Rarobacter faecitabidus]